MLMKFAASIARWHNTTEFFTRSATIHRRSLAIAATEAHVLEPQLRPHAILLPIWRRTGGRECADPISMHRVRTALSRTRAVVVDLDQCLIGTYVGSRALVTLVFSRRISARATLIWLTMLVRMRWSYSWLRALLPRCWRVNRVEFQCATLQLESYVSATDIDALVKASLPGELSRLRHDLLSLLADARCRGLPVVLATANSERFAVPIASSLGIAHVVAGGVDRTTHKPISIPVGEAKARQVLDVLSALGVRPEDTMALADLDWSRNDLPLLQAVGIPVVVLNR